MLLGLGVVVLVEVGCSGGLFVDVEVSSCGVCRDACKGGSVGVVEGEWRGSGWVWRC